MSVQRKRRELRDLRSPGYTFPEAPDRHGKRWTQPPDQKLRELASNHGFKDPTAAQKRLNFIYEWWRGGLQIAKNPEPTGKERQQFLAELIDRARLLQDALNKLDGTANKVIYEAAGFLHNGKSLDLRALAKQVKLLQWAASAARSDIPHSKAGRHANVPLLEMLAKLWRMYVEEFGPSAKRLTRVGDLYSGKFFRFAWDATRIVGLNNSNNALGKAIEIAQAKVKENDSQGR